MEGIPEGGSDIPEGSLAQSLRLRILGPGSIQERSRRCEYSRRSEMLPFFDNRRSKLKQLHVPSPFQTKHGVAGIAQRLERQTRDRKVAGLSPGRSGGSIFFFMVNFLC